MCELESHYSAQSLVELGLISLPKTKKSILTKAKRENWKCRVRQGKGGGYEYAVKSMPEDVQAEIVLKLVKRAVKNLPVSVDADMSADAQILWAGYEQSTEKQQTKAQMKLGLMLAVAELVSADVKVMDALELVAMKHNQNNAKTVSVSALKNWWYAVKDAERSLWLPLLVGYQTASGEHREAEFTAEAWAFFKADYFRNERPQFGSCYERLKRAAGANGWVIPSASSIKRKIEREVPKTHQVYLRKPAHCTSPLGVVCGGQCVGWSA